MKSDEQWLAEIDQEIELFARRHGFHYRKTKRQVAAAFEIGCFLAVLTYYTRHGATSTPVQLNEAGEFRYLTSPSGNPDNFSYVRLDHTSGSFELRQQIRIRSHIHEDVAFTPDLIVLPAGAALHQIRDRDYGGGKQRYCFVDSRDVIAAHECKSMIPFPELLVSFLGLVVAAHEWLASTAPRCKPDATGLHLAPTLFVGGSARALHNRMVEGMSRAYPINIVLGLHRGTWNLQGKRRRVSWKEQPTDAA